MDRSDMAMVTPMLVMLAVLLGAASFSTPALASPPSIRWQHAAAGWGEPAADGSTAYFLTRHHELVALDAADGRLKWRVSTGGGGDAPWGSRAARLGPHVVVGDGAVRAFEPDSGRQAWLFAPRDGNAVGPFLGDADATRIAVGSSNGRVHLIDAKTGRPRWSRSIATADTTVFAPVLTPGGVIAAYRCYSRNPRGGLVAFDHGGRVRWRHTTMTGTAIAAPPVVAGDLVIAARTDGVVEAFDTQSGRFRWRLAASGAQAALRQAQDIRPLAVSGGRVIAGSLSGEIVAVDQRTGAAAWRYGGKPGISVLRLRADAAFVYAPYTDDSIVALDATSGAEAWRAGGEALPLEWPPTAHRTLVFAAGSTALVAIEPGPAGREAPDAITR